MTGEVLFDSVKLYSFSLPLSTPVGEDFDSPYLSFLTDYPTHPLAFYSYLQIAQFAEDKWEGKREKNGLLSAISGYDNIAKHFPLYRAWALIREADISIRGKDYRRAEEIGEKLLKEFPHQKGVAFYLLSEALKEAGDYQKALNYAQLALENSKEEDWFIGRAKNNQAYTLEMLGEYKKALEKYKSLAEHHKDQRPLSLLGAANCYFRLADFTNS